MNLKKIYLESKKKSNKISEEIFKFLDENLTKNQVNHDKYSIDNSMKNIVRYDLLAQLNDEEVEKM